MNKEDEEIKRRFQSTSIAIALINEKHPGKVDAQGSIECPECKGKLNYTKNSYNGHVWGHCETEECLRWMQ